jgi:peptide/nickel transport system permease protein
MSSQGLERAVPSQAAGQLVERTIPVSPGRRTLRRFLRHRLAVTGAIILALLTLGAVFAPIIAPYDPNAINLTKISQPPDRENWLGTDRVGRDIFTRVLYGGRISLSVGFVAVGLYVAIGFVIGALAGYLGGWVDNLLMRFTEIVMCFPTFVLILILVGMLGPNIGNVILVIGLFGWTGVARLVRGQVLQLRELDFVTAARAIGGGRWYVMVRHITPNLIGPLTVAASLGIAGAILTEAGLSFLGLGVTQPTPSWGSILNEARNPATLATQPWLWLAPGAAISLAVLAANFLGDGLRDAFDVKSRAAG